MDRTRHRGQPREAATGGRGPSTHAVLTGILLRQDMPDATEQEVRRAVEHVERSVAAMPDVTRAAVRAAGVVVHGLLCATARGRWHEAGERERGDAVTRLTRMKAPGVSEYVKLTRGLALVAVHESRSGRPQVEDPR